MAQTDLIFLRFPEIRQPWALAATSTYICAGRPGWSRAGQHVAKLGLSPANVHFEKVRSRERRLNSVMAGLRDQCMLADCGHIVVADDDASLRQIVMRYLEDHNVPTKSASNRTEVSSFGGEPSQPDTSGSAARSGWWVGALKRDSFL